MDKLFRLFNLPTYLVFIILIIFWAPFYIWDPLKPEIRKILSVLGYTVFFGWIYLSVHFLNSKFPPSKKLKNIFFNVNIALVYLCFTYLTLSSTPGVKTTYSGISAIPGIYLFFAFIYVFNQPAYALVSLQKKKKMSRWDAIPNAFAFFFFPFGIWYLHPAMKKTKSFDSLNNQDL